MRPITLTSRTLAEIGKVLHVHEATISRRLKRATDAVRKQLMRNLERGGMNRKAAEEALGTDPRDLDLKMDLRKLLQSTEPGPFKEQDDLETGHGNSGGRGRNLCEGDALRYDNAA